MKQQLKKKLPAMYNKAYPLLLIIATFMMSIAYASVNGTDLNIATNITGIKEEAVVISEITEISSTNAKLEVKSTNGTIINTHVLLSTKNIATEVTYSFTIYNNTDHDYYFEDILCDTETTEFYSNPNIIYQATAPAPGTVLPSNRSTTITLTFSYKDGATPNDTINELDAIINFKFEPLSTLIKNIETTLVASSQTLVELDSSLNYQVTVKNNNQVPIYYDIVNPAIEELTANSNQYNLLLEAGATKTTSITVSTIPDYFYKGQVIPYTVNINMGGGSTTNIAMHTLNITTPGSPMARYLAEYELDKTVPQFTENITTTDKSGLFTTTISSASAKYFRGLVSNNYVTFSNQTWRIIRLNADGTTRLVLDSALTDIAFSNKGKLDYTNSILKQQLDTWYTSNLNNYTKYINPNILFIHDNVKGSGKGNTYQPWTRLTDSNPNIDTSSFDSTYLYSISTNPLGNGNLTYPIGTLTVDELMLAGATNSETIGNTMFFLADNLETTTNFWTLSPASNNEVIVFQTSSGFAKVSPKTVGQLKPVIELTADTLFKGTGTKDNPYVITN